MFSLYYKLNLFSFKLFFLLFIALIFSILCVFRSFFRKSVAVVVVNLGYECWGNCASSIIFAFLLLRIWLCPLKVELFDLRFENTDLRANLRERFRVVCDLF